MCHGNDPTGCEYDTEILVQVIDKHLTTGTCDTVPVQHHKHADNISVNCFYKLHCVCHMPSATTLLLQKVHDEMFTLLQLVPCSRCATGFMLTLSQLVPCTRCDNWFHVHVVATGFMLTLSQLVSCSRCDNWFHVHFVATGFMFTLSQLVPCSRCDNWFHVHVVATGFMFTLS